ncbi:hypothetical protein [Agromyces mariniharenae]|uniref:Uncharacterized protein n=1 Tax=Agromyces mariniharenae TaxID=2604423 RepID=A0A5S4V5J8_9MICO|nr:hypothetical protein [Agromyces mariniharenae]TYL53428.1 hypothetical protein FYC51_07050 [Agromyces mariniharenae]
MSRDTTKRPAFEPASELAQAGPRDPRMRRPVPTSMGAALVLLRVFAGIVWLIALAAQWNDLIAEQVVDIPIDPDDPAVGAALWVILAFGGVLLLFDLVMALLIYLGFNWPRIVVMVFSTLSISGTFAAWWAGDQNIALDQTLFTLALDILIMLALSSRAARDYARRNDRRLPRVPASA